MLKLLYYTVCEYTWNAPAGHTPADVVAAYDHLAASLGGTRPFEVNDDTVTVKSDDGSLTLSNAKVKAITRDGFGGVLRGIQRYPDGKYRMLVLLRGLVKLRGKFVNYDNETLDLVGPTAEFIRETDGDNATDEFDMFETSQVSVAKQLNATTSAIARGISALPQGGVLSFVNVTDIAAIQVLKETSDRFAKATSVAVELLISLLASGDPTRDFTSIPIGMDVFTRRHLPAAAAPTAVNPGMSMRLDATTLTGDVDRNTAELFKVMKTLVDHIDDVGDIVMASIQGVIANQIIRHAVENVVRAEGGIARANAFRQQVGRVVPRELMEVFEEALRDEIGTAEVEAILAYLDANLRPRPPARVTTFPPSRIHTAAPGMRGRKKRRSQTKDKKRSKSARSRRRQRSKRRGGGGRGKGKK